MSAANATAMAGPEYVTDDNKAPLIRILAAFFLCLVVLACFARNMTKIWMTKTLKLEDWLALAATLFAVAQYVVVITQTSHGFGKHGDVLSQSSKDTILVSQYVAEMLFILGLLFGKLTGAMMTMSISNRNYHKIIQGFQIVCGLWALSSIFVVAFECGVPKPWNIFSKTCIRRDVFWMYFSIFNIVSDLALVGIMIINVRGIQTTWAKKAVVMCVFGSRILVVPAAIAQLVLSGAKLDSKDFFFDLWDLVISAQLVQCLSILAVCIPVLKPFMDSAESGLRLADTRRLGQFDSAYAEQSGSRSRTQVYAKGASRQERSGHEMLGSKNSEVFEMSSTPKSRSGHKRPAWDGQSHTSQTILIQQSWNVDVEQKMPSPSEEQHPRI